MCIKTHKNVRHGKPGCWKSHATAHIADNKNVKMSYDPCFTSFQEKHSDYNFENRLAVRVNNALKELRSQE